MCLIICRPMYYYYITSRLPGFAREEGWEGGRGREGEVEGAGGGGGGEGGE